MQNTPLVPKRHVLVALGWYDPRFLEGIGRCARECQWHLASRPLLEASGPGEWQGDGFLAKDTEIPRPRPFIGRHLGGRNFGGRGNFGGGTNYGADD